MPWARLDDRFHDNRKVRRVWRRCPEALGLHVMAITYCAAHLTDGIVDADFVEDRAPVTRSRDRMTAALVEAGLWRTVEDGWEINDFTTFNGTRAAIEARRRAKQEAGKAGASARWGDGNSMAGAMTGAMTPAIAPLCEGDGSCHGREMPPSRPVPTPTPTPVEADASTSARPPSKRADQTLLPLSLPGELHHSAHLALTVLRAVQAERGGDEPTLRGVGLAVQRFPNRDHAAVARELEHWALAGTGQARPVKDWARTFATFLERSPAGKPVRVGETTSPDFSAYDRAAGL